MFGRLNYKQKLKWLGAAAILVLFLCYQLSIRKTAIEYTEYRLSSEKADPGTSPVYSMNELKARDAKLADLYNVFLLDTLTSDKNLLSIAGNFCKMNKLRLKEYKPVGSSRDEGRLVLTRIVTVEGQFIPCLKFLYELERVKNAGKVTAAEFQSYKDARDKSIKLDCTIYIQNLIPN